VWQNGTQEIKDKVAEAIQKSPLTQEFHLKVNSCQQQASSSSIPSLGADSIRQLKEAKKKTMRSYVGFCSS
jgi:hypothetical protein